MTRSRVPVLEWVLMLAVVASVVQTAASFASTGYLTQPFVFDTNDTFMDWFNTAFWANRPGAFEVWRTIYPPLSFAFLDLFSLPGCYVQSPFHARDCDWLARTVIYGFYVLTVVMVSIAFWRNERRTAVPRSIAFALGLPLLFTLERGNLILVALPFFIIAYGQITTSERLKALSIAATINFKPYLILPALALAVHRKWRPLELAGIATVLLYLLTLALVGSGSPQQIMANTANWVVFQGGQVWNEINYSTSYAPFTLVRNSSLPLLNFVPSRLIEGIEFAVPIIIRTSQLLALVTLAFAWLQPQALSPARIATIMFGTYLITQSPGGYTQSFLLFLVFLERRDSIGITIAVICSYLLMLVYDIRIASVAELSNNSWLGGTSVRAAFGLTVGHFIRPGLIVILIWALALDSLLRIYRARQDHRPTLGLSAI